MISALESGKKVFCGRQVPSGNIEPSWADRYVSGIIPTLNDVCEVTLNIKPIMQRCSLNLENKSSVEIVERVIIHEWKGDSTVILFRSSKHFSHGYQQRKH